MDNQPVQHGSHCLYNVFNVQSILQEIGEKRKNGLEIMHHALPSCMVDVRSTLDAPDPQENKDLRT